jgi:hypothetical protein
LSNNQLSALKTLNFYFGEIDMALIDDVKAVLNRLAPLGWKDLLAKHGLDIAAANLETELARSLGTIRHDLKGFETFTTSGIRAIEPGSPAKSLLYHALASADVHPTADGIPSADSKVYPTFAELDTIENYIYSRSKRKISAFANPVIVVVAYQYRHPLRSPHGKHADLAYSRVGVSRVGTEAYRYDAALRSFSSTPKSGGRGFAVLPARYAAFIAEYRNPSVADSILRTVALDRNLVFTFPVHKLFPGQECLFNEDDTPLNIKSLKFVEYHINEKLRRIHTKNPDNPDFIAPLPIFNLNTPPFTRDSLNSSDLVTIEKHGASILVVPHAYPTMVRTATQKVGDKDEIARFKVPPANNDNRFWTSLQFRAPNGRSAPEYANIRHEVVAVGTQQTVRDLMTLKNIEYVKKLQDGNYEAAHFIDDTCDGVIGINISGLSLPILPAYSLVTAVDFFPQVDQVDIQKWVEKIASRPIGLASPDIQFRQGAPTPLNDGRFDVDRTGTSLQQSRSIPNPTLPDPMQTTASGKKAFIRSEAANLTATAIVGRASSGSAFGPSPSAKFPLSWLPDTAADVFAPGWDISQHNDSTGPFYAAYGLGSPFPEDSKLCAALNSFWPAAAPDTARTFGNGPTGFPLMDSELGYHPQHPRVLAEEVQSSNGCDGEFAPFFESVTGTNVVNFADRDRSDYVTNALNGLFGLNGLETVTADEMIARMEALRFCIRTLPPNNDAVPSTNLWLVTAEKVKDWAIWNSKVNPRADAALTGAGYIYTFVVTQPPAGGMPASDPPTRRRQQIANRFDCHLDRSNLFFSTNGGAFQKRSRI